MVDLQMSPGTGTGLVRHAGDRVTFTLGPIPPGWQARLRTNIGRADRMRDEIVRSHFEKIPLAGASWQDLPMEVEGTMARITLPLTQVGHFKAKAFAIDPAGNQSWPHGPDVGVGVHPSWTRTANIIYCAFPRMFGAWSKSRETTGTDPVLTEVKALDEAGWTAIPPGGTLRNLIQELPHIFGRLGCRILHLLPVSPVPTTFARFGRYGSPYALQDLTAIDPALVEFDRRTTGVDQFVELTRAVHARNGRVMLDLVINHTGWGSREWNDHPEWFLRGGDGRFHSPGAWDVVWEDLVEFDQRHVPLWDYLAKGFLTWCRRGVDAFRCDAGYKVPVHVWQFITARVRQEFPDTVFLLEGLGGPWETTHQLLAEGGMQWAYSELFQNAGRDALGGYLTHAFEASGRHGTFVHYSETHDNTRLAARGASPHAPLTPEGRRWSLHRNRLCALTSVTGGFGFTNGVEWCATEQLNVHSARGLHWGNPDNIIDELAHLNRLLASHPCFFDGAQVTRLDSQGSGAVAWRRDSAGGANKCLVLVNADFDHPQIFRLPRELWAALGAPVYDLCPALGGTFRSFEIAGDWVELRLEPGAVHCLASVLHPQHLHGDAYREARARADWAMTVLNTASGVPTVPNSDWIELAATVDRDPVGFLAGAVKGSLGYPSVVHWRREDSRRRVLVPPGHWLLVEHPVPFRARLTGDADKRWSVAESIRAGERHIAAFPPRERAEESTLFLDTPTEIGPGVSAPLLFLGVQPVIRLATEDPTFHGPLILLTNGRGGMSRMGVDLGRITSKYDCVLAANLHPRVPVDRHVYIKRLRAWINADGFVSPLNIDNLIDFEAGPPAHWRFIANAGDGRSVEIRLLVDLLPDRNTVVCQFTRATGIPAYGRSLPSSASVRITVRLDIEDRSFHSETQRNGGADHHFHSNTRPLVDRQGFGFTPSPERNVRAWADLGQFHWQPEWSENLPHGVEATRGMTGRGDAWSPGWFDLPLAPGSTATVIASADPTDPERSEWRYFVEERMDRNALAQQRAGLGPNDLLGRQLVLATQAFVVRRDDTRTVIAGYPWFLDWGRDSLIAARGLISAGMADEVQELLITFARFEKNGTLPNSIHGEDASNRDTSDAPLWFGIVCEELAADLGAGARELYARVVDDSGRALSDVLRSIASGYLSGTSNGIRVDHASGLVWSPSHFTWMDTNHPAGTPREGFPVEIQVLWIRLLQQLARLGLSPWDGRGERWEDLARRALHSFETYFWLEESGWLADCLMTGPGGAARTAAPSNALRSNALIAVALDLITGEKASRMVEAARKYLVVPGALRSLAPLPVVPPLPVRSSAGHLLNDPDHPYWPRYEGDEDTRRKPAYHNGTAWTWTFPMFCEALAKAYPGNRHAREAARAYLSSVSELLGHGCLGQIPEIVDGDFPHTHRGCDAQAWSATEALRVWRYLQSPRSMGVHG
jgi:predicted glycogen debranching enzyme